MPFTAKRVLSAALSLAVILPLLPLTALADNGNHYGWYNNNVQYDSYSRYHRPVRRNTAYRFSSDDRARLHDILMANPGLIGLNTTYPYERSVSLPVLGNLGGLGGILGSLGGLGTVNGQYDNGQYYNGQYYNGQYYNGQNSVSTDNQLRLLPLWVNSRLGLSTNQYLRVGIINNDAVLLNTRTNTLVDRIDNVF